MSALRYGCLQRTARTGDGRYVLAGATLASVLVFLMVGCGGIEAPDGDLLSSSLVLPGDEQGMVTFLSGEAFLRHDDIWSEIEIGNHVVRGDLIKVVDNSYCDLQFGGTAVVRVQKNTILEMDRLYTSPGQAAVHSELLAGTILVKVRRLTGNEEFSVRSQGAVLGVRGTEFLVHSDGEGTLVAIREGAVGVTPRNGGEVLLGAGEELALMREDGGSSSAPRASVPEREDEMRQIDALRFLEISSRSDAGMFGTFLVGTVPGDAALFAEGHPAGTGSLSGILPVGTGLSLSVRKNGYREAALLAEVPSAGVHRYTVSLEQGGIETVLAEEEARAETRIRELNVRIERLERELVAAAAAGALIRKERDELRERERNLMNQIAGAQQKVNEVIDLRKREQSATERLIEGLRQMQELPALPKQPTSTP